MKKRMFGTPLVALVLALALLLPLGAGSLAEAPAVNTPMPAEAYAKENPEQSVYDMAVTIAGVTYPLPVSYQSLLDNGWKPGENNLVNPDKTKLEPNYIAGPFELVSGKTSIEIDFVNLSNKAAVARDCAIGALRLDPSQCSFDLAGVTDTITAEKIVETLGRPGQTQVSSDGSAVYTYTPYGASTYQLSFGFEKGGALRSVYVRNFFVRPAYNPSGTTTALRAKYTKPTALAADASKPIFELDGVLYKFPCPLGEFLDNGWKVAYVEPGVGDAIEAGRYCTVSLSKGSYLLDLSVSNPGTAVAAFSDCVADTLTDSCSPNLYAILRLSGGIEPGITADALEKLLGSKAGTPQTYESRGGCPKVTGYYVMYTAESVYYNLYFDAETKALVCVQLKVQ